MKSVTQNDSVLIREPQRRSDASRYHPIDPPGAWSSPYGERRLETTAGRTFRSARKTNAYLAILSSTGDPPTPSDEHAPLEDLLQRRLTRARFALGALGMLVGVSVIVVGATVWYWLSYLLGPSGSPFTRGPYLTRVTATEAALRWRVRAGKQVTPDCHRPGRRSRRRRARCHGQSAARYPLRLGRERR